jgi:hypothetical protein
MLRLHAFSFLSPQVIYAPVISVVDPGSDPKLSEKSDPDTDPKKNYSGSTILPVIMFSMQFFDPQCRHVIPTANMSSAVILVRFFAIQNINTRPPCLLHAILSCPMMEIYQIILASLSGPTKNSKIWVHLTWGYIAKGPTKTGNYNRITDKGPLKGKDELTVKDH